MHTDIVVYCVRDMPNNCLVFRLKSNRKSSFLFCFFGFRLGCLRNDTKNDKEKDVWNSGHFILGSVSHCSWEKCMKMVRDRSEVRTSTLK